MASSFNRRPRKARPGGEFTPVRHGGHAIPTRCGSGSRVVASTSPSRPQATRARARAVVAGSFAVAAAELQRRRPPGRGARAARRADAFAGEAIRAVERADACAGRGVVAGGCGSPCNGRATDRCATGRSGACRDRGGRRRAAEHGCVRTRSVAERADQSRRVAVERSDARHRPARAAGGAIRDRHRTRQRARSDRPPVATRSCSDGRRDGQAVEPRACRECSGGRRTAGGGA